MHSQLMLVTEAQCDRGTKIQGTKGEIVGDMHTFVSSGNWQGLRVADAQTVFDFLTRKKTHHEPVNEGGLHGGADIGFSRTFVKAVAEEDQTILGITPEEALNSHLLVFAGEKARVENKVIDFAQFKSEHSLY